MRLALKPKAATALQDLHERLKAINPALEPSLSAFLERFMAAIDAVLNKEQWTSIAERLTSERIQAQRKRERLLRLSEKLDESDIEKFEAKIERRSTASNSENAAFSTENS